MKLFDIALINDISVLVVIVEYLHVLTIQTLCDNSKIFSSKPLDEPLPLSGATFHTTQMFTPTGHTHFRFDIHMLFHNYCAF